MIKISVIVPVYNVERYLDRCMESLLHQTLKELEIILVDDGSKDRSGKICDSYASYPQVRIIHKQNAGLGFARNSGLELARGEFVAFVDSDDYVETTMYETLWNAAQAYNADGVYSGYNRVDEQGCKFQVSSCQKKMVFIGREQTDAFLLDMMGTLPEKTVDSLCGYSVWMAIYRRSIIEEHNLTFCSERQFISEDILFNLDFLSQAQTAVLLPECLYCYCCNANSLTQTYRKDRYAKNRELYLEVCRRLAKRFDEREYRLRADRLFFARARLALIAAASSYPEIQSKELACEAMKAVCNDDLVKELCQRYPYRRLPFKHRLMFWLMKEKHIQGLCWIVRLRKALERRPH